MDGPRVPASPLPARFTQLFGRETEIVDLGAALATCRLLTLVGAPGCGKTRLAVELGDRVREQLVGGAWFVDLASIADAGHVSRAAARAVRVAEEPGGDAVDALVEHLARARVLIVLDNCEHVIEGAARLAAQLLVGCPEVRIVATSRMPLGVPGEQVWWVPPLASDDAVAMFSDRAALAVAARAEPFERGALEAICEGLGRLPLALELAAAWTRVLSPAEIRSRLDDARLVLRSGGRGMTGRQETMEAAIDWSYQLLTPAQRALFDGMAVFADGAELEAVDAVAGAAKPEVLEALVGLVEHCLVVAVDGDEQPRRYRLLEPLRQFAATRARAAGDERAIRQRHAAFFLDLATRCDSDLRGDGRADALRRLEREAENCRVALEWLRDEDPDAGLRLCAALAMFWELSGRVNEGRAWLDTMLGAEVIDAQLRTTALARAGRLAWRQRDYAASRQLLEESLVTKRLMGDELGVARRLRALALVAMSDGDAETARELCEEALASFRLHGDDRGVVWTLVFLGVAQFVDDDLAGGSVAIDEALTLNEHVGDRAATAYGHLYECYASSLAGDAEAARGHLDAALETARASGGVVEDPDWLWAAAALATGERRLSTALRLRGGAEELSRRTGSHLNQQIELRVCAHLDEARRAMGPTAADQLMAEGATMDLDDLMVAAVTPPRSGSDDPLSTREREIAELVAAGLSNGEIAELAFISKRTVESHVDHIKQKIGARSRSQIVAWMRG